MKPTLTLTLTPPDPVPVPNLQSWLIRPCGSGAYAGGLDNRIGLSSGADLRLSVCCRPGRYMPSDKALYRSGFVISSNPV